MCTNCVEGARTARVSGYAGLGSRIGFSTIAPWTNSMLSLSPTVRLSSFRMSVGKLTMTSPEPSPGSWHLTVVRADDLSTPRQRVAGLAYDKRSERGRGSRV